jgi:HEAT repeat protein
MGNNGERQTTAFSGRQLSVVLQKAAVASNGSKAPMFDHLNDDKLQQFQAMLLRNEITEVVTLMKSSPDSVGYVEALLFDKKNEVVMLNAALALVQYNIMHEDGHQDWERVDGLLKSGDPDTRAATAWALSKLSQGTELSQSVVHTLGDLISDESPEARQYATDALAGAARNEIGRAHV